MSNFLYKGVSVTDKITTTAGGSSFYPPGYNFLVASTSYAGERPLTFGYFSKSGTTTTDISNLSKAPGVILSLSNQGNVTQGNVTAPNDCKSIRVCGIGGGGGAGGVGGNAKAKAPISGKSATGYGGPGGTGGYGTYTESVVALSPSYRNIAWIRGNSGNTGASGNNNSSNGSGNTGGQGGSGNAGNQTYVTLNNGSIKVFLGTPGNGGAGGNGAKADAGNSNTNSSPGNQGSPGNATTQQTPVNFPTQAPAGNPGQTGALQIIFLYD